MIFPMRDTGPIHLFYGLALIFLLGVGCQPTKQIEKPQVYPAVPVEVDHIAISLLANRLGLQIAEQKAGHVKLQDSHNYVMISTMPQGQVYVNGRAIGSADAVVAENGQVLVSRQLESRIRLALLPPTTGPPPQEPPVVPRGSGTVMIDPGHGGKDPGAISVNGYREKHVNLGVSKALYSLLRQQGYTVRMTRERDVFLELDDRVKLANRWNPQLFVSIHADSICNRYIRGFTIYIAEGASRESQRAANLIEQSLINAGIQSRGIRRANYRVLKYTRSPAVLVELGYLTNQSEAALLASPTYQLKLAHALAAAISDFLNP
jgi:N-acetylmuramoyl-L-alanine amidase